MMQLDCLYSGKSVCFIIQLFSCSMLPFIGQSRKKVGHTEESCVWLRWYSTDSVRDNDIVFFVGLLEHDAVYCSNTRLLISSCPDVMEWSAPACLYSEKEKLTQTESKSPSVTVFPIHPPHPDLGCCNSGSRRKEEGQVQLIRDQWWSVCVLIRDQEQWVGPAPPLPYTNPDVPPSTHFSPDQSSRTCKQRWPPLALHCQRMMQQRHRRWPPPWTEGGGVTGAK